MRRFETDTSLTRNDYYLANGDDYSFNGTLFKLMTSTVSTTSTTVNPYVRQVLLSRLHLLTI